MHSYGGRQQVHKLSRSMGLFAGILSGLTYKSPTRLEGGSGDVLPGIIIEEYLCHARKLDLLDSIFC